MKRILITGNLGYVGAALLGVLRDTFPKADLVGYDAGYFVSCVTTDMAPERFINRQFFGDIREVPREVFEGVDVVIHLAAISNDPMGKKYAAPTDQVNHLATLRCAKMARDAGVRSFVFASSCSVYGASTEDICSEHSQTNPLTAYAKSKLLAEAGLAELVTDTFRVGCLRFGTAYGWSSRVRLDLVLNDFASAALHTSLIRILSDGTPWRPMIHVEDMAKAFIFMSRYLYTPNSENCEIVNVGSMTCNFQVKELAVVVAKNVKDSTVSLNTDSPVDQRSYAVDFSRYNKLNPDHVFIDINQGVMGLLLGMKGSRDFCCKRDQRSLIRLDFLDQLLESGRLNTDLRWNHGLEI